MGKCVFSTLCTVSSPKSANASTSPSENASMSPGAKAEGMGQSSLEVTDGAFSFSSDLGRERRKGQPNIEHILKGTTARTENCTLYTDTQQEKKRHWRHIPRCLVFGWKKY